MCEIEFVGTIAISSLLNLHSSIEVESKGRKVKILQDLSEMFVLHLRELALSNRR